MNYLIEFFAASCILYSFFHYKSVKKYWLRHVLIYLCLISALISYLNQQNNEKINSNSETVDKSLKKYRKELFLRVFFSTTTIVLFIFLIEKQCKKNIMNDNLLNLIEASTPFPPILITLF